MAHKVLNFVVSIKKFHLKSHFITSLNITQRFYSKSNFHTNQDRIVTEPYRYLLKRIGTGELEDVYHVFNNWLNVNDTKLNQIKDIMVTLHATINLIDDIQDESIERESHPTAHLIYGIPSTINSSIISLLQIKQMFEELHPDASKIFIEQLILVFKSQGLEIHWKEILKCPTEDEFDLMAQQKAGQFYLIPVKLMQLFSENQSDFSKLVLLLGQYYQIYDDYVDLKFGEMSKQSTDLKEGKFGFPIVHAINNNLEDTTLIQILKRKPTDNYTVKCFISLLEKYGSFEYTKEKLKIVLQNIENEVKKFDKNLAMEELLTKLNKSYRVL